ncbi:hypothetical protein ACWC0C_36925 [Streptomyces sp. NPDC001709]
MIGLSVVSEAFASLTPFGAPISAGSVRAEAVPGEVHPEEFSGDGGRTWELNWITDLSRTGSADA